MKQVLIGLAFIIGVSSGAQSLTQLQSIEGKKFAVPAQSEKVLVALWATWCPDCRKKLAGELPELDSRKEISVVTVNTDRSEKRAKAFIKKTNLKLPVYRDPSKSFRKEIKAFSVPHWAVYKRVAGAFVLVDSAAGFQSDRVYQALELNSKGE